MTSPDKPLGLPQLRATGSALLGTPASGHKPKANIRLILPLLQVQRTL